MLASSKPIHCFSPLSRKLDVGWPRIEDFQLRGHSCVNNVQRCLCHFYTWMRHSKQTATLLLTKRHANFDTSTSAKEYARVCTNCACTIVVLGILLPQARPTMPCIRLVLEETINIRTPAIIGRSYTETKPRRYSVMPRKGRRSPPYPATEKWSSSVNPR